MVSSNATCCPSSVLSKAICCLGPQPARAQETRARRLVVCLAREHHGREQHGVVAGGTQQYVDCRHGACARATLLVYLPLAHRTSARMALGCVYTTHTLAKGAVPCLMRSPQGVGEADPAPEMLCLIQAFCKLLHLHWYSTFRYLRLVYGAGQYCRSLRDQLHFHSKTQQEPRSCPMSMVSYVFGAVA